MTFSSLPDAPLQENKSYRFIVDNVEQAVFAVRQKLGDNAQVLSVKQINEKGLARFFKAPRLEVVATVPEVLSENPKIEQKSEHTEAKKTEVSTKKAPSSFQKSYNIDSPLKNLLKKSGFSDRMLSYLQSHPKWAIASNSSLSEGLTQTMQILISQYQKIKKIPIGQRIAFLGTPGVGKTTLLCKHLANSGLEKETTVLKLSTSTPNSDETLSVFCNALGLHYIKNIKYCPPQKNNSRLYLDLATAPLKQDKEWDALSKTLDHLEVDTRIWVVQAAYEDEIILANLHLAQKMKATHLSLTHMDEVHCINKLWDYLCHSKLSPFICSHGPSISNAHPDTLEFLIQKAFPTFKDMK